MTASALNQRNYARNNKAKGLCAQCANPLAKNSIRWCARHVKIKLARGREYSQLPKYRANKAKRYKELRAATIIGFGGKCECCGEATDGFLTFDHRNNDGYLGREFMKTVFKRLIDSGFPKDEYQLLCFNCNLGKAKNGGVCPHKQSERKA